MEDSQYAAELINFIDSSPSPYHAVEQCKKMLLRGGFSELDERSAWHCTPGGAYFVVRDGKSLVAWRQGMQAPVDAGFRIVAAHSDSPCLKVRPSPKLMTGDANWLKPDLYGSLLLHTWLDRDVRPTGAVFYRTASKSVETKLVDLDEMVFRACSLAPHLRKDKLNPAFQIDRERDMIMLHSTGSQDSGAFVSALASAAGVEADALVGYDLFFADIQSSRVIGARQEFLSAPRLDNLFSTWAALSTIVALPSQSTRTAVVAIFDAEEIGSQTWAGARSTLLDSVLTRTTESYGDKGAEMSFRARANSVLASLDMAHADHPAHGETIDPDHVPAMNEGIAIKGGSRGNYAIAPLATSRFVEACERENVPLQKFMYRCDHGGGSSVGPISSSALGIAGFDLGAPLVSMHSIREVAGVRDISLCQAALNTFYQH